MVEGDSSTLPLSPAARFAPVGAALGEAGPRECFEIQRLRRHSRAWRAPTTLAALLLVALLPVAAAGFESVCGSGPSGANDCPWYQVEVIIFRNDVAAAATREELLADAEPRLPARIAALLPPPGESLRPRRIAELQTLWQAVEHAPRLDQITPGLTLAEERFLDRISSIGLRRTGPDLRYLRRLDELRWTGPEPGAARADGEPVAEVVPDPVAAPDPEPTVADAPMQVPELAPILEIRPEPVRMIPMELAFRAVPPAERLLDQEANRLARNRGYQVLSRMAWRQPFAPNEPGMAQLVYSPDLLGGEVGHDELLLGTLTIDLRRFLHAHLDLYFREAVSNGAAEEFAFGEEEFVFVREAPEPEGWLHIRTSRRMRSGELHYLDHPRIGALIRIERFELEEEEPTE